LIISATFMNSLPRLPWVVIKTPIMACPPSDHFEAHAN
jgi:hypothetical protein